MSVELGDRIADQGDRPIALAQWTVVHAPGAAAQAIATKAAGAAGVKHVCTGIIATISAGVTAQTPINVVLLDGVTTVFSASLACPANGQGGIVLSGLWIEGTAATLMTLQFSAAGVAASVENCTLVGVDVI